jgi:hypothetical protein
MMHDAYGAKTGPANVEDVVQAGANQVDAGYM